MLFNNNNTSNVDGCLVQSCRAHQISFVLVAVPLGEEKTKMEKDTN